LHQRNRKRGATINTSEKKRGNESVKRKKKGDKDEKNDVWSKRKTRGRSGHIDTGRMVLMEGGRKRENMTKRKGTEMTDLHHQRDGIERKGRVRMIGGRKRENATKRVSIETPDLHHRREIIIRFSPTRSLVY
jgi:hypothetical protein